MSGLQSELIGIGGNYNSFNVLYCEKYSVALNKWDLLPYLNIGRLWPGSILLKSKRAFCFCGIGAKGNLNSIERLEVEQNTEWELLSID